MRLSFTVDHWWMHQYPDNNSCNPPPVWVTPHYESLINLFQGKPVSRKYLSNLDFKMCIVLELTTDAGSLFQWSTTLTLNYDLWAIVLYLYTFNFIPLPLVTKALFISNSTFALILSNLFRILKTSIISPLILYGEWTCLTALIIPHMINYAMKE